MSRHSALAKAEPAVDFRSEPKKPSVQLVPDKQKGTSQFNLAEIARECIEEAKGNAFEAAVILRKRMDANIALYREIGDGYIS